MGHHAARIRGFGAKTGDDTKLYRAFCLLPARLQHLYCCRSVEPAHVKQPGNPRLHWMPLEVDGTWRHEALYVHCTLGGARGPNQLASWWLLGGSEECATLCAAAQEVDSKPKLARQSPLLWPQTQHTMACEASALKLLQLAIKVCALPSAERNKRVSRSAPEVSWKTSLLASPNCWSKGAINRHIPPNHRIPNYRLHGVLRVTIGGISGMRDAVSAATGQSSAIFSNRS